MPHPDKQAYFPPLHERRLRMKKAVSPPAEVALPMIHAASVDTHTGHIGSSSRCIRGMRTWLEDEPAGRRPTNRLSTVAERAKRTGSWNSIQCCRAWWARYQAMPEPYRPDARRFNTMTWLQPITLRNPRATLEPLTQAHHDDLVEAVQDGELWKLWYTRIPSPEKLSAEIARRLELQAQGAMLPFAVIDNATRKAVGMTTYMNVDKENHRVEIGSTWYRKGVQRTDLNTQCKLTLLTHAFESLECIAVEFRTHYFNYQSRKAIERLGAKLDGILRSHQRTDNGTLRDTCVYSIIASEWPTVKAHLQAAAANPSRTR
jgi:RimJ/RimL family protein N-acetyltransferase